MAHEVRIRILIADDFKDLRDQVRQYLEEAGDMEIIGEATNLNDAEGLARNLLPDVIIMNDYLPPIDSAHAASFFQKQGISSAILVISNSVEYYLIFRCFQYGVKGFMHLDEMAETLLEGIRKIHQGGLYFSPRVKEVYGSSSK